MLASNVNGALKHSFLEIPTRESAVRLIYMQTQMEYEESLG